MSADLSLFHIFNPSQLHRAEVRQFVSSFGPEQGVWVERTSHPTHLQSMIEWCLWEGKKTVAIWGGDGSLNRAMQALYDLGGLEKMAVAIIPAGTANDFARKLALPDWKTSAQRLLGGRTRRRKVDLGVMHMGKKARIFLNNAGFGRDEKCWESAPSNPLRDIKTFQPHTLNIAWEAAGKKHEENARALLGVVCNGPFFNKGMYFARDVQPFDGILNAFLVPPQWKPLLVARLLKSRLGGSLSSRRTRRYDVEQFKIESDRNLYPQADGDPGNDEPVKHITFSVLPQAAEIVIAEV